MRSMLSEELTGINNLVMGTAICGVFLPETWTISIKLERDYIVLWSKY